MALRKRTRRQEADLSLGELSQGSPAKRLRLRNDSPINTRDSPRYPPEFWDKLSKIELTREALGELDRRTKRPRTGGLVQVDADNSGLTRFSRQGGPDLSDLRGVRSIGPDTLGSANMK